MKNPGLNRVDLYPHGRIWTIEKELTRALDRHLAAADGSAPSRTLAESILIRSLLCPGKRIRPRLSLAYFSAPGSWGFLFRCRASGRARHRDDSLLYADP